MRARTIYVVFKTHFDIGFTGLASDIVKTYQGSMLKSVLETCEATALNPEGHRYVWTMSSWPLKKSLETGDSEMREKALKLMAEGRLAWHALPFTTHTDFSGIEEFIRGMGISDRLDRKFGRKHISAKMTDVPGHTRMLPSLLSKAGIKFLHLGCNACVNPPEVPRCFYWKGPDGNGVITFYTKGGYGTDLLPPDDWEYPVWLALMNTSDNKGPHSAEIIRDITEKVQKLSPGTEVVIGSLDDFARAFLDCRPELPVIETDLADSWIHGIGTYPAEVSDIRRLRKDLMNIEAAIALREISGRAAADDSRELIDKAYENILLFDEHTWGMDTKICLLPLREGVRIYDKELFLKDRQSEAYKLIERSWQEKSDYAAAAAEALRTLAGRVESTPARQIEAYNILPWERGAEVDVTGLAKAGNMLVDKAGENYPVKVSGDRCTAYIPGLPPMGSRVLSIEDGEFVSNDIKTIAIKDAAGVRLENGKLSVLFDEKTGRIKSFFDKVNCKEWASNGGTFGSYTYDIHGKGKIIQYLKDYAYDFEDWYLADNGRPGYPWVSDKTYTTAGCTVEVANTENSGVVRVSWEMPGESIELYGNAASIIMSVELGVEDNFADITYEIKDKEETPFVESGHFIFPLNAASPRYTIEKMGAVIDPEKDIEYGANTSLYCCDRWMDVCDGEYGIAFFPKDTPLLSIGSNRIYVYSKDYKPQKPVLYWNAFNNQWGTNFPQWKGGNFKYEFRLYPYKGTRESAAVQKMAEEYATPVFAARGNEEVKLLAQGIDNADVLCFKKAEDNNGFILRLRESTGIGGKMQLNLAEGFYAAAYCSLMEENLFEYANGTSKVIFDTASFEVHTFRIMKKE